MNRIYIILFAVLILSVACSEEDDYKKYLEGGEIYYPGKVTNARVFSGKNRVHLYGLFVSDPKVTQCLVYWNIRKDSVIIPVERQNIVDTLDYLLDPVEEGIHNFEFITMDAEGNRSIVVNSTGQSYGEKFVAQLLNRPIRDTIYMEAKDSLAIWWANMDLTTGAYETEVQYNLGSNAKQIRTVIGDTITAIPDYDGSGFKYRTFFKPDSTSIDVFWTEFVEVEIN